ncbi:MAG TPA: hypothetical protein VFH73_24875, partial [Polyangia bacterium]|nr:hypothetical protein [Polyangia bacterium]
LWWVGKDGSRDRKLGEQEVAELVATRAGIVAATKGGEVRLIRRTLERGWSSRLIARLNAAAWTATRAADGSIFIVTETQLLRVTQVGKVTALHTGRWGKQFGSGMGQVLILSPFAPQSIIVARTGDIFIGMNAVVVHLVPRHGGYDEEWLMPRTCVEPPAGGRPTTE